MRFLLIGYNDSVLAALDGYLPAGSVTVLEEADLWEAKHLAERAAAHPCLGETLFAAYQQNDAFLDAVSEGGKEGYTAVAAGLEYAVPAAARAAELLGLPGAGPAAAEVLRDKLRLREEMRRAGLPGPDFQEIHGPEDLAAFGADRACVVKPANRQASLGVLMLAPGEVQGAGAEAAWRYTTSADEGVQLAHRPMRWRYLVEERMTGPEVSTEALVRDGEVLFCNLTHKCVLPGQCPVEIGHTVTERAPEPWWTAAVAELAAAIGYGTGILHAEWIITDGGPRLVECAGRPPGDRIMDLIDLAYPGNVHQRWLDTLSGRPVTPAGAPVGAAAIRFLTAPRPGRIAAVAGAEEASTLPGVVRLDVTAKPGAVTGGVRSSWDRLGFVVAVGGTAEQAEQRARTAADAVSITLLEPA